MSELLKSKDILELFGLSAPTLFSYREIFNIPVIETFEGKKKVYYYSHEAVELIRQIVELKKSESSNEVIKKLLNISDNKIIHESLNNESQNDSMMIYESVINDKVESIKDGLTDAIKLFYTQFNDNKIIHESLINQSKELGKYQAESIEKERLINQIKISNISEINQIKMIHELEINQLKALHKIEIDEMKKELENKNIEIERLKSLRFWQRK